MKYVIQHRVGHGKNAGSKAVRDVVTILSASGYEPLNVYKRFYHHAWSIFKIWIKLKKNDEVVLQWPFYFMSTKALTNVMISKKVCLILLLHDINSYRGINSKAEELKLLDYAHKIIVHTESMKDFLVKKGICEAKMFVLTSFDYLTDEQSPNRTVSKTIVYAGNLKKSEFLQKIPKDSLGIKFNCYGLPANVIPNYLSYQGAFSPENISVINGSWGLIWDGDSIETCSGPLGEYLKINSPHKMSLYIVSGLPVIVWKQSALARYVTVNNLGITVDSLKEIKDKIDKIDTIDYQRMLEAVKKEAAMLRSGAHLRKTLDLL